jgi:hypothetical protein
VARALDLPPGLVSGRVVAQTVGRDSIRSLFDGLVPVEVIDAYDQPLASNGCAKDQAETLVGDAGLVAALTSWGMAHIPPAHSGRPSLAAARLTPTSRCKASSPATSTSWPATRNSCSMATGVSPTPKPSSVPG